jgi:hypothetical protein
MFPKMLLPLARSETRSAQPTIGSDEIILDQTIFVF